jgi:hypothetical protein
MDQLVLPAHKVLPVLMAQVVLLALRVLQVQMV